MTALERATAIVRELTFNEKHALLRLLQEEVGEADVSGIVHTPGVCGGRARIVRTRIPVWVLVDYKQKGVSDERLLTFYPTLTMSDLQHAWRYYESNQDEIERDIAEQEEE